MHGFVNPRPLAEGSYEFGSSVHPSVVPSTRPSSVQKFSWNWSSSAFACPSCNLLESFLGISLLETQRSVMGLSGVVLYLANFFFLINSLWAKITKNGVLGLFYTIGSFDLVKIDVKKY